MKLTKRDKKLLAFLAVVLILYLFGQFLIVPALEQGMELSDKVAEAEAQKHQMQMKMAALPQEKAVNTQLQEEFSQKAQRYYPMLTSQKADREVTELFLKYGMELESLTISMPGAPSGRKPYASSEMARRLEEQKQSETSAAQTEADPYSESEAAAPVQTAPGPAQNQIYAAEVSLKCTGAKKSMERLIDFLTNENPAISVMKYSYEEGREEVRVNTDGELEKVTEKAVILNITLQLYMCDQEDSGPKETEPDFAPADIRPADGQPTEEEIAQMEAERAEAEAQQKAAEAEKPAAQQKAAEAEKPATQQTVTEVEKTEAQQTVTEAEETEAQQTAAETEPEAQQTVTEAEETESTESQER